MQTTRSQTRAVLVLDSWAGRTRTEVEVLEWIGCKVKIRALVETRLAGRCRVLQPGQIARVPIGALVFPPSA